MENVITQRCCGNCEWSISPENEEDIMLENHYDEDDPTRPRAGDCCLGIDHGGNFVCKLHEYLSGGFETHVFYDDKDKIPGYYIVNTYYDHIIKYFKLYRMGEYGKYSYGIRVCDLYPIDKDLINGVSFEIEERNNELLYKAITIFAKALNDYVIFDDEHRSFMSVNIYENSTGLYFTGDKNSNFVDIIIDNDTNDKYYKLVCHLFRNMAVVTSNSNNEFISKKIRKLNK